MTRMEGICPDRYAASAREVGMRSLTRGSVKISICSRGFTVTTSRITLSETGARSHGTPDSQGGKGRSFKGHQGIFSGQAGARHSPPLLQHFHADYFWDFLSTV